MHNFVPVVIVVVVVFFGCVVLFTPIDRKRVFLLFVTMIGFLEKPKFSSCRTFNIIIVCPYLFVWFVLLQVLGPDRFTQAFKEATF